MCVSVDSRTFLCIKIVVEAAGVKQCVCAQVSLCSVVSWSTLSLLKDVQLLDLHPQQMDVACRA